MQAKNRFRFTWPILYRLILSVTAEYMRVTTVRVESARLTRTIVGFPDLLIPLIASRMTATFTVHVKNLNLSINTYLLPSRDMTMSKFSLEQRNKLISTLFPNRVPAGFSDFGPVILVNIVFFRDNWNIISPMINYFSVPSHNSVLRNKITLICSDTEPTKSNCYVLRFLPLTLCTNFAVQSIRK